MPPMEQALLFDKAVVWEFVGNDRDNEPTVLTPYEITCRWEGTPNTRGVDQTGQLVRYDAFIIGEEEYPLGSIFWLGYLDDLPAEPNELYRSVSIEKIKDIRGIDESIIYNLQRFTDTLPDIMGTS